MIIFEGHHKFGHDHFRTEIWDIDDLGRDVGGRQVIHFPEQLERPSGHEMWQWKNNYTALLFCNYQWIFPLKMVIFYSYVSLPEGNIICIMLSHWKPSVNGGISQLCHVWFSIRVVPVPLLFFFIHPFPSWITSVICDESSEDWLSQIKHVLCSFQWQCYPFFCELKQRKPTLRVSRNIGNINKKRRGTLW